MLTSEPTGLDSNPCLFSHAAAALNKQISGNFRGGFNDPPAVVNVMCTGADKRVLIQLRALMQPSGM